MPKNRNRIDLSENEFFQRQYYRAYNIVEKMKKKWKLTALEEEMVRDRVIEGLLSAAEKLERINNENAYVNKLVNNAFKNVKLRADTRRTNSLDVLTDRENLKKLTRAYRIKDVKTFLAADVLQKAFEIVGENKKITEEKKLIVLLAHGVDPTEFRWENYSDGFIRKAKEKLEATRKERIKRLALIRNIDENKLLKNRTLQIRSQGLKHKELSDFFGYPVPKIKNDIYRTIHRIKEILNSKGFGSSSDMRRSIPFD